VAGTGGSNIDSMKLNVYYIIAYTLTASMGSFGLTGETMSPTKALHFQTSVGTFNLTGENMNPTKALNLTVSTGFFGLTGENVLFQKAHQYVLIANTGIFTLVGYTINFASFFQNQVTRLTKWIALRKIK
jgi:hypothetical protein